VQIVSDLALLLGSTEYSERELFVDLLTQSHGVISVHARRTKKSPLLLQPFHRLRVELAPHKTSGFRLRAATIDVPRMGATLDAMMLAGQFLRWIRASIGPEPHPEVFALADETIARAHRSSFDETSMAQAGFALLALLGVPLSFDACAACGRPRPPSRPAWWNPLRGGVVCQDCHDPATDRTIAESKRLNLALNLVRGASPDDAEYEASVLVHWVEQALAAVKYR
jgi:DNA repair protein RecO